MSVTTLAGRPVKRIGLGCMNLSHAYALRPSEEDAVALLNEALDAGYNHLDTASLYGNGVNERLLGQAVMQRRDEFLLASKCGMRPGPDGRKAIDGRPETLRQTCEDSLRNLGVDHIDLYYLHRWDKRLPIEDSVGELARLKEEGKIGHIGLSEVSAPTLRRAYDEHPIAAVQSEYSLMARNPEIAVLEACEQLDITFVAFSPVARGMLAEKPVRLEDLPEKDMRHKQPRFQPDHFPANLKLVQRLTELAGQQGCHTSQLALAWLLHQSNNLVAIPGTISSKHLRSNLAANDIVLPKTLLDELDQLFHHSRISGARKPAATANESDTEEFADAG